MKFLASLNSNSARAGRLLLAFGLLSSMAPARAEVVEWLYQVVVPVADQTAAGRSAAGRAALEEVLMRVSGVAPLPLSPALDRALAAPERYYSQFRFLAPTREAPEQKARFDFAPSVVLELAKRLDLPVWWANRPRVVPWVVLRDGGERVLTANEREPGNLQPEPFQSAFLARARQRGVPVVLPEADETGAAAVLPSRVVRGDLTLLRLASESYGAEAIASAQITRRGSRYSARWNLFLNEEQLAFQVAAADLEGLGAAAADALANELAARFAASGGGGELRISLHDVTNPTDLATVLGYLDSLEFVDQVALTALDGAVLSLRVRSQAGPERFLELLAMDGVLGERLPERGVFETTGIAVDSRIGALSLRYLGAFEP